MADDFRSPTESLLFEVREHVAWITINRPEAMNAFDPETYAAISAAWVEVRDNPKIWVAVVTGAGERAFSAGADLKKSIPQEPDNWHWFQTQEDLLLNKGLEVWKPVIAAVNGYCLGGGMTLLLATDIRIASAHATFGLSEVKRGIFPANGGSQRVLRQLPYPIAMEMLLLGEPISAQQAERYGLINRVVPKEQLIAVAADYARRLSANAPLAMRAVKELAVRSQYMNFNDGLRMEALMMLAVRQTEDAKEGPRAFAEKRPPTWRGS